MTRDGITALHMQMDFPPDPPTDLLRSGARVCREHSELSGLGNMPIVHFS